MKKNTTASPDSAARWKTGFPETDFPTCSQASGDTPCQPHVQRPTWTNHPSRRRNCRVHSLGCGALLHYHLNPDYLTQDSCTAKGKKFRLSQDRRPTPIETLLSLRAPVQNCSFLYVLTPHRSHSVRDNSRLFAYVRDNSCYLGPLPGTFGEARTIFRAELSRQCAATGRSLWRRGSRHRTRSKNAFPCQAKLFKKPLLPHFPPNSTCLPRRSRFAETGSLARPFIALRRQSVSHGPYRARKIIRVDSWNWCLSPVQSTFSQRKYLIPPNSH
jgi:hypothetical protein